MLRRRHTQCVRSGDGLAAASASTVFGAGSHHLSFLFSVLFISQSLFSDSEAFLFFFFMRQNTVDGVTDYPELVKCMVCVCAFGLLCFASGL